jgi:DNA-binding winged helix-turn-helix (wHTH) protein
MSYKYFLDGGIEYLPQSGEILVDGHVENLQSLENKLLIHFVTNPDQLITKEQLYKVGWDDRIYGDNPLSKAISNLRGKLKDNPRSPKYIKTVPKKGFRFVSQVSQTPIATDNKVPQGHQEIHHAKQLNYLLIGAICLTALWALIDSLFLQSIQGKSLEIATIKPVTQTPGKKKYPNLSPDQQYVIYSQKTTIADVARIALKHVYSSEEKFITSSEYDSQLAIWHQDGRRILYQRFAPQLCEIAIIELDEKLDVLNDQVVSECGSFSQSIGLSWGPDNTIYYTNTDLEFEAFNIYQLDIHSGKRDTFAIPDVDGRGYYSIHYDPTSDKVHALLSYDWYYTEVVTLNREGKILNRHRVNTPLFTVSSYKGMPVFRTQSNHIHYLLDNKEYRLMQSPLWPIYSPHFSNGSPLSMVFVGGAQNNSELLLVDLEKQTETILTNSSSAHKYPVMSNSGVLYFISNQSGVYQIWS